MCHSHALIVDHLEHKPGSTWQPQSPHLQKLVVVPLVVDVVYLFSRVPPLEKPEEVMLDSNDTAQDRAENGSEREVSAPPSASVI